MPFEKLLESISKEDFRFNPPNIPVDFREPLPPITKVNPSSLLFWQHGVGRTSLSVAYVETRRGQRHVLIDAVKDTTVVPFGRPTSVESGKKANTAFRIVLGPDGSVSFYAGFSDKPASFKKIEPNESDLALSNAARCKELLNLIAKKVHSGDKTIFPLYSPPLHIRDQVSLSRDGARENFFKRVRRSGTRGGSDLSEETSSKAVNAINHIFNALEPFSK